MINSVKPIFPRLAVAAVIFVSSVHSHAQETAAQRLEMSTNQLKRLAATMSQSCLNDIRSLDDWKNRRPELRRQLLEMLGLDPMPARTPLKPQITGRIERGAYRIEKIVFQSLPGLYVTGNFYLTKGTSKALPTILYLCGHSPNPAGAKVEYQDRAIWFASHGYNCLVLDTLEFGEVAGIHHGTHNLNMWNWLSLGYTPAGVEVWNAIRALDYLETRPEVDRRRFGLTGISGGGAMTWYTAAVDERIAAAAPVCSTITYGSQAAHWIASGQCDCIYYNNSYLMDFPVVGALIAPRPLLIISGQRDIIFPPDGYHEAFRRSKKIYDLYAAGSSDHIREVEDNVGHSDPPFFLREARQWMQHWLKGDATRLPEEGASSNKEPAGALACLIRPPADAINYKIQNQFTSPVTLPKVTSLGVWERHRTELMARLKEKVFHWFPMEQIPFETQLLRGSGGYMPKYVDYKEISFQTEPGVRVRAQLLSPKHRGTDTPVLIYVKRAGDSIYFMDTDELLPILGRCTVLILNPRFTEQPLAAADYADVERTAVWVGRTVAAMQLWDIRRAVRWVFEEEKLTGSPVSIYGKGEMAALALYTALFEEKVKQVILNEPPASHWQRPALLNILRVTDLPEIAGALAPRRIVAVTKLPDSFDYTKRLYRLQKASTHFVQAGSLPEALEIWKLPSTN